MSDRLRPLEDLTRILLDAELAKLRQLSQESRLREDEATRLGEALATRSEQLKTIDPLTDLALQTGQDAQWQAWAAHAKKRLMREAAEVAARREAQRKKAQRAFGQVEALAGIRRLEDEERMLRAARRVHSDPDGSGRSG
ncbi:MAG TPA: hypothetical protein DIU07_12455 [Rhodobacteraceae bacterium]|nr:hypothetical protein [Paracoccaceae bacterium]